MYGSALKCDVCNISCTGQFNLQQHLASERHKKKEAAQSLKNGSSVNKESEHKNIISFENNISNRYYCEICDCACNSREQFEAHIRGSPHEKKRRQTTTASFKSERDEHEKNVQDGSDSVSSTTDKLVEGGNIPCDLCGIVSSSMESYISHLSSAEHLQMKKKVRIISGNTILLHCKICSKVFSGDIPYMDHLKSAKHQKKEREFSSLSSSNGSGRSSPDEMQVDGNSFSRTDSIFGSEIQLYDASDINVEVIGVDEPITFN